jgi:hypothetical protein
MGSAPNRIEVISNLIVKGWIPLRQLAVLLGYRELRGIYARQKGRNAIQTMRIGGIERVYTNDVLETLENVKESYKPEADALLALYRTGLKAHERQQKTETGEF